MMQIIVKGKGRKPRRKRSNANDAKDVIQEARETHMDSETYFQRMHEVCRDTPGERCEDLKKARELDMQFRQEKRW